MEEGLRQAVCNGNEDLVKIYISDGVDINSQNAVNGWTALHWAAKRGHVSIVKLLLESGAKADMENKDGKTASNVASVPEIITLLGGELTEQSDDTKQEKTFIPNYLANPEFPYSNTKQDLDNKSNATAAPKPQMTGKNVQLSSSGFLFQPTSALLVHESKWSPCGLLVHPDELVLKVRLASIAHKSDFIEVGINRKQNVTLDELKMIICKQLGVTCNLENVKTIRKLPDTLLHSDTDVCRLTDYQMLEVVLDSMHTAPSSVYGPSSANTSYIKSTVSKLTF